MLNGRRIMEIWKTSGMSPERVAADAQISVTALYNIVNGADAKTSTALRLAHALGVPLSDILADEEVDNG